MTIPNAVISCCEHHSRQATANYIREELGGLADRVFLAGGAYAVVNPHTRGLVRDNLIALKGLHQFTAVHVLTHGDCFRLGDRDHLAVRQDAETLIKEWFNGMNVEHRSLDAPKVDGITPRTGVITCADPRLLDVIEHYIEHEHGGTAHCLTIAGACHPFNTPEFKEVILTQLDHLIDQGINRIEIWQHHDCGKYGGFKAVDHNPDREHEMHEREVNLAIATIKERILQRKDKPTVTFGFKLLPVRIEEVAKIPTQRDSSGRGITINVS